MDEDLDLKFYISNVNLKVHLFTNFHCKIRKISSGSNGFTYICT